MLITRNCFIDLGLFYKPNQDWIHFIIPITMISKTGLRRKLKSLSVNKCLLVLAICVILINEYFIYTFQAMRWISMPQRDKKEDMVILFISDPQLIGIQDEIGFPIGPLIRWDADRYLRSTFSRVYKHTSPDIVIFLGDILDEGSKATDEEYISYVHRFNGIFRETKKTKTIILPGDNDIGGEGGDFRTPFKVHRFEKHFGNLTGLTSHKFVDFLKLDIRPNYDNILEKKQLISSLAPQMRASFRIVLNHDSMMVKTKSTIYPILKMAQPCLLISGHWHLSQMFTCDICLSDNADMYTWPYKLRTLEREADFIDINLSNLIALNELMVPTCSYRMGVPHMGYGVGVVSKSGSMRYTVLWLPSRYSILFAYLIVLAFIVTVLIVKFILTPCNESKTFYR